MEEKPIAPQPRKMKFAPKAPSRKPSKPAQSKTEVKDDVDAFQRMEFLRKFNESSGRGKPKFEKKSTPVQVAFGQGSQSSFVKSYGHHPKNWASRSQDGGKASVPGNEKIYNEPWNYYTYYPVTLPLRRPYSGNPVVLDEEEFGEAATSTDYNENYTAPAEELGLMEESSEERMLFFQLPASLPFDKRSASAEVDENANNPKPPKPVGPSEKVRLKELPPGLMGKLLVYKSGTVKLKLGDMLYDVSAGSDCMFAQDVLAVNTAEKHCCVVGELSKRAIVTPDVDSLLKSVADF